MNLAAMTLTLYLRNPAQRSPRDDLPLIVLPNGRRIVIFEYDYDVTAFEDWDQKLVRVYRLYREFDSYGNDRAPLGEYATLDDVAKKLAEEGRNTPAKVTTFTSRR